MYCNSLVCRGKRKKVIYFLQKLKEDLYDYYDPQPEYQQLNIEEMDYKITLLKLNNIDYVHSICIDLIISDKYYTDIIDMECKGIEII